MSDSSNDKLIMEFDPNTIQHLGIHMYSTLPPVIAELVANSYDADARLTEVILNDKSDKQIIIKDDGHGMTFDQINDHFLKIGRNRRVVRQSQKSESGNRYVIGKKGLGKLSFFGIASEIIIETVRDGIKNVFTMDWEKLELDGKDGKPYEPKINIKDKRVSDKDGTTLILQKIRRKSLFSPEDIAYNLSKSFQVFDEPDFEVRIYHNDESEFTKVTNKLKYANIETEFKWTLPFKRGILKSGEKNIEYEYADEINGEVIASKDTVPSLMKGIALFSRGKLVNDHSFYDVIATSHGYSYLTGWLNVDFIDDWDKEVISTNRRSLNWEDDDAVRLKEYLTYAIYYIYNEHRRKKQEKKKAEIKEKTGVDIDEWIANLPKHERRLAKKIVDAIIQSEGIDSEKAGEMVSYVKDSFQYEFFKELAAEITEIDDINDELLIKLLKEWELIEAKEFYKLSLVRVKAINTFERYIKENAKEVPTTHNFLKTFPWLLDPRIMEFRDEVYFSDLLKKGYPETDVELESDRRIDFLCTSLANQRFVIELKRPQHRIKKKDIEQAQDYRLFVENHSGTEHFDKKQVFAYIVVGDRNVRDNSLKELINVWEKEGKIFIRTYGDLLEQARKYHSEFIDRYELMENNIKTQQNA